MALPTPPRPKRHDKARWNGQSQTVEFASPPEPELELPPEESPAPPLLLGLLPSLGSAPELLVPQADTHAMVPERAKTAAATNDRVRNIASFRSLQRDRLHTPVTAREE
jgi:hypothetical protein